MDAQVSKSLTFTCIRRQILLSPPSGLGWICCGLGHYSAALHEWCHVTLLASQCALRTECGSFGMATCFPVSDSATDHIFCACACQFVQFWPMCRAEPRHAILEHVAASMHVCARHRSHVLESSRWGGAAFGGGPRPTSRFFQDFTTPSDSVFVVLALFSLFTHESSSAFCHETL